MTQDTQIIRDTILQEALPDVAFDGWTDQTIRQAAVRAGHDAQMVDAVFPGGLGDILDHFADFADREMLRRLAQIDPTDMRVRDRVHMGVMQRLRVLAPHREALRLSLSWFAVPGRQLAASKILWRTSDHIWNWAGDTATDYNRYTKRGLLSGVLTATTLFWLEDSSPEFQDTDAFLGRRIENVLNIGRAAGRIGDYLPFLKKRTA